VTSLSVSLSSLLAATVAFAIGTSVVLRDRRRDQFVLFAVFCFNLGLYHLARFFFSFSNLSLFGWFAQTISLLLPWSADRCLSSFVPAVGHRGGGRVQTTLGMVLVGAQTISLLFPDVQRLPAWDIVPWALTGYVFGGLLWASMRVWRAARAAQGTATAARLRYLFYASLVTLVFGSPLVPAVGPIMTAIYLYFVAQTLVRERLLDLPEVAMRILSLTLLVIVITSLYALLLVWIPAEPGNGNRSLFLFNAAVATFAVLVLVEPVRTEIESRIEGWLFRDRPILRRILVQLRHKLTNVIDADEMAKLVMGELQASGRVTQASLYVLDRQGTGLTLRGHLGAAVPPRLDLAMRRPLLDEMLRHGVILRDVLERERHRTRPEGQAELDEMFETLAAVKGTLALSIIGRPREGDDGEPDLLGALFVDDERLLEPFSREEIELFEGVVAQAATTLQNSAVYEARKERDRLAALGEMSAGLAHEIRNPLGAIKGAVLVMEPQFPDMSEETREFLQVIVEEVERLNRVVTQFLTYSRPFKGEMVRVDLRQVIASTVRLLAEEQRAIVRVPDLDDEDAPIPRVRGDADALQQVLLNLLLNALDAVGDTPGGEIWLSLSVRRRGLLRADAVVLDVCDNGPGLSNQTLTNLFVPFHTTKTGGTGLGLPISQRIVENHRGAIEVGRTPEGGARFTVLLPADEDPPLDAGPANEASSPSALGPGRESPGAR
jgi:signal transduction histidine kinase